MPVIKSAKKRMHQNAKRKARNFPVRSEMKTVMKIALTLIKDGKLEEAVKYMPRAYSVIDTAAKKKILKPNTAARKKSRIARALNLLEKKGGKVEVVKAVKAPKAAAKVEAKDDTVETAE
jgi:small subunit ribosomal protein S20